jgi:hypothetical protein
MGLYISLRLRRSGHDDEHQALAAAKAEFRRNCRCEATRSRVSSLFLPASALLPHNLHLLAPTILRKKKSWGVVLNKRSKIGPGVEGIYTPAPAPAPALSIAACIFRTPPTRHSIDLFLKRFRKRARDSDFLIFQLLSSFVLFNEAGKQEKPHPCAPFSFL